MKRAFLHGLLRPALLAALVLVPARDEALLRFEVKSGTVLEKSFSANHEAAIEQVGFSREGSEVAPDGSGGWVSSTQVLQMRDAYVSVEGGRVRTLRRTVKEAGASGQLRLTREGRKFMEDSNISGSPFFGMTFVHTWVEEEGVYARRYERDYGEEEWLQDLDYDFDALGLLPPGPVQVGASWEIEPERLRRVLAPGGDFQVTPRSPRQFGRSMKLGVCGDLDNVLGPVIAGSARATLESIEEREGMRFAKVVLECEIASSKDRTELYDTAMPPEERKEPATLRGVEIAYTLKGSGVMLWNLTRGHLAQLDLSGPETFRLVVSKTASEGGEKEFEFSAVSAFGGTLKLQLVVKPAAP